MPGREGRRSTLRLVRPLSCGCGCACIRTSALGARRSSRFGLRSRRRGGGAAARPGSPLRQSDLRKPVGGGVVDVRRQVKVLGGRQVYAPPKGRKVRDVPLPESVALDLAAHLQTWPAVPVELPWEDVSRAPRSADLLLPTRERTALRRNDINPKVWRAGPDSGQGRPDPRERHARAPALFTQVSCSTRGSRSGPWRSTGGHADRGFTLRVHTHLVPASEERTERAVDLVFGGGAPTQLSTARAPDVHQGDP